MNKLKKGKITLIISISCTAFILTMIMFTQFKTVKETDITGIETMRESELRAELSSWKEKYEDVNQKIVDIEDKMKEYNDEILTNNNATSLLQRELEESKKYAGQTDVTGEGIIVTLSDNDKSQIIADDLIRLVNELKNAGAEAISINDQRIITTTDIVDIRFLYIVINTSNHLNRISSPYTVKAIGNKKYLESSITLKNGYMDFLKADNKSISYATDDNILIPKYNYSLNYENAKDVNN